MVRLQSDDFQQFTHAILAFFFRFVDIVDIHRFSDDLTDRHTGIEARIWILEDHLHILAEVFQLLAFDVRDIFSLIINLPRCRIIDLYDSPSGRTFTTAAFPDQTERFTWHDLEADAVYGLHHFLLGKKSASGMEMYFQILYFQDRFHHVFLTHGQHLPFPVPSDD